jgi:aminomethyltransferase
MTDQALKRTPLYDAHTSLGGRMVEFGGWAMPVQYSGILDEHRAVRTAAGLFDVSHMGEFEFTGPGAEALVQYLTANDVNKIPVGRAQYSMLLNERGGVVDDIIVYHIEPQRFLMVVNGSNVDKDWAHVSAIAANFPQATAENRSADYALLALQGPKAAAIMEMLTDDPVTALPYYGVMPATVGGLQTIVARTGYTGEDGFEIFVPGDMALALWENVLAEGEMHGLVPAGLGARDTLRLEAAMPLYGHELDDETSPLEAGLGMFVAKEGDYIGAEAIRRQRAEGLRKKLVMLEVVGKGIPRQGYPVTADGQQVGTVVSGGMSPSLNKNIAVAYVDPAYAEMGRRLDIMIRERPTEAVVVKRPFYKRNY